MKIKMNETTVYDGLHFIVGEEYDVDFTIASALGSSCVSVAKATEAPTVDKAVKAPKADKSIKKPVVDKSV